MDVPDDRERDDITGLLDRWRLGDAEAANRLMELVYGELHRIAAREMRRERPGHTLQTTAVLHECLSADLPRRAAGVERSRAFLCFGGKAVEARVAGSCPAVA